jgi:hypothetical protein
VDNPLPCDPHISTNCLIYKPEQLILVIFFAGTHVAGADSAWDTNAMPLIESIKEEFRKQPLTVVFTAAAALSPLVTLAIGSRAIDFSNLAPDVTLITILCALIITQSALGFVGGAILGTASYLRQGLHMLVIFIVGLLTVWIASFTIFWLAKVAGGQVLSATNWFQFAMFVSVPVLVVIQVTSYFATRRPGEYDGFIEVMIIAGSDAIFFLLMGTYYFARLIAPPGLSS